jgi:hypothetical protein
MMREEIFYKSTDGDVIRFATRGELRDDQGRVTATVIYMKVSVKLDSETKAYSQVVPPSLWEDEQARESIWEMLEEEARVLGD